MKENRAIGITPGVTTPGVPLRWTPGVGKVERVLDSPSEIARDSRSRVAFDASPLQTGLRKGELLKPEWSDVDFDHKLILVKNTKSKPRRNVPMNALVVQKLKSLASAKGSPYVFIDPNSSEAIKDIERAWKETLKPGKIERFRFHDLRHYAESPTMPCWRLHSQKTG